MFVFVIILKDKQEWHIFEILLMSNMQKTSRSFVLYGHLEFEKTSSLPVQKNCTQ